jgi:hypothetical protein
MVLPHLPHFQWGWGEVVEQDVLFALMVFSLGRVALRFNVAGS